MKSPQMHRLTSQALDRARDTGWCTGLLLNREHTVAMYRLRALRRMVLESIRLMATVRLQHGWIMNTPIFTHQNFHIMFHLLNISSWNSCLLFTSGFFYFCVMSQGEEWRVDPFHFIWTGVIDIWHWAGGAARETRRAEARWQGAHQFIVVHCLQLDKLKQLEVTEKRNPFT